MQELHTTGGNKRLHSWRAHTRFRVHWDPAQRSDSTGAWDRPTCRSWRVSWGGSESAVAHCGGKDTGGRGPREYDQREVAILAPRPGPTQQPAGSSAGMPQAKQPAGETQPLPSADRLPKVVLSSQSPLNTPPDMGLSTRRTRPSSTHQWAGSCPSHQEACTSPGPTSPSRGRHQKQEELQSCSLQKGDHKHRKLDKMRWQEICAR